MGSSHISIKEVKLDRFGEIEGVLFAKVPIVPRADVSKSALHQLKRSRSRYIERREDTVIESKNAPYPVTIDVSPNRKDTIKHKWKRI